MRIEFTLRGPGDGRQDYVVDGDPGLTLASALGSILQSDQPAFVRSTRIDREGVLGSAGLVSGDILSVGRPTDPDRWPLQGPCLVVRSGPAAGSFLPILEGNHVLGRDKSRPYHVGDPTVSSSHAEVACDHGRFSIKDLDSSNGTFIGGKRLRPNEVYRLEPGVRFLAGRAVCSIEIPRAADGAVETTAAGERAFNRVMRYLESPKATSVAIPPVYDPQKRGSMLPQYLTSGVMLAGGVVSAIIFNNVAYAVLGLLGPVVMLLSTYLMGRGTKQEEAKKAADNEAARKAARERVLSLAEAESRYAWASTLDPADAHLAAVGPTSALWSIDASDERALLIRMGTDDLPAMIEIQADEADATPPTLWGVPVSLDLRQHPILGIAGDKPDTDAAARAIVLQLVTGRSPRDLGVYYLSGSDDTSSWSWVRWLPHVRTIVPGVHTVTAQSDTLRDRLTELTGILDQRLRDDPGLRGRTRFLPEILVLLDGASALRSRPAVVRLLEDGPRAGMSFIALERTSARLPVEATARMTLRGSVAELQVNGLATLPSLVPDFLQASVAETSARALSALVPLGGTQDAGLPSSVRFHDVAGISQATPATIVAGWAHADEGKAVIGIDELGNRCVLNIVKDGPHALVAGSTGSGKSEFLRSWLAGLALSASPDNLSMMLIDYKGGGAFGRLRDLPHVVAYADDLTIGGPLANRLLDSLRAELDYRKAQFKLAGNVGSIGEYRQKRVVFADLPPIARLLIMVDEFAELKEAQPDFVDGLVNVARIGRSLGVHLVLATQQPAGVVTAQIRDNANIRVCLRVIDSATSVELVRSPIAASFPNDLKGRAVYATGEDSSPTVFQAAYVSGTPPRVTSTQIPPARVTSLPWAECGRQPAVAARAESQPDQVTDLTELVDLLREAVVTARIPKPRVPWLEPLPDVLTLPELGSTGSRRLVPFALEDLPRGQRQQVVCLELGGGNIGIAGGRGSGRSTSLRTIAASLAQLNSADQVHLYVIDHTPAASLRVLESLPHCGLVATRGNRRVIDRLLARLLDELTARSAFVSEHQATSFAHAVDLVGDAAPPNIVVLVDGWDSIAQDDAFTGVKEGLLRLAQDGPALGIQLVVAGGMSVGTPRLTQHFAQLLCLPFEQRDDLRGMGVPTNGIPDYLPPGRAYRPTGTNAVQIALLDGPSGAEAQSDLVRALAATLPQPMRHRPMVFRELPQRISLATLTAGIDSGPSGTVLLGAGGDEALPVSVDLVALRTPFVVAGPPESGRTTALATLAEQLLEDGLLVLVHAASHTPDHQIPCTAYIAAESDLPDAAFLIVDNADRVGPQDALILAALGRAHPRLLLAGVGEDLAGYGGWKSRLAAGASGLLLSPRPREGDVVGITIGTDEAFSGPAGRAYFVHRGRPVLVQVATPAAGSSKPASGHPGLLERL